MFPMFFHIKGEVIRVGKQPLADPLPLTCTYFHDIKSAKWAWLDPFENEIHRTLPICNAMCNDDPPLRNFVRTNWTQVSY